MIRTAWANGLVINYMCTGFKHIKHAEIRCVQNQFLHPNSRAITRKFLCFMKRIIFSYHHNKQVNICGLSFPFAHSTYYSHCKFTSRECNIHFHLPLRACLLGRFTISSRCLQLIWGESQWSRVNEMSTSMWHVMKINGIPHGRRQNEEVKLSAV